MAVKPDGRCKYHGGMSTGPRTATGKRRSGDNLRRWHEVQRLDHERSTDGGTG